MRIRIYSRNIDKKLKVAMYAMTEFAMAKLVPSKKLRDNISIDVHLRKHLNAGEAKLAEHANRYRPRDFKVLLNHHDMEKDDYGRERTDTEWAHEILKTLAHELVHVKQYVMGELTWRDRGLLWKGHLYTPEHLGEYFDTPYEIEAFGRERGLLVTFLAAWSEIEKEMGIDYSV
jgi:hypothetical protein